MKSTALIDNSVDPVTGGAAGPGQQNKLESWDRGGQKFDLHALSIDGDRVHSVEIQQNTDQVSIIERDLGTDGANSSQRIWNLVPGSV